MRPDAVSLASMMIHGSPIDVPTWPATIEITQLTMQPGAGGGLSFLFSPDPPARWDYHMPGWGDVSDPGNVRYTVWAAAQIAGQWHAAAFIQMWQGRPSTGASLPTHWSDWAYAPDRWGAELVNYRPKPGDQMAFFVTAGNARDAHDVTSVKERSNVVLMELVAGENSTLAFTVAPPFVPPPPVAPPQPVAEPQPDLLAELAHISQQLTQLSLKVDALAIKPAPRYTGTVFGAKVTLLPS